MRHSVNNFSHPLRRLRARLRAYTLIELLVVLAILQLAAGMVAANVSAVQRSERLSRAGQQVVIALRYARILAMSSGQPAGVEFDTATHQFRVYQGVAATTAPNNLMPGGTYMIDFKKQPDVVGVNINGVSITNPNPAVPFTNPYKVAYGTFGTTKNNGTITLKCNSQTITITIPTVGEAKVQ